MGRLKKRWLKTKTSIKRLPMKVRSITALAKELAFKNETPRIAFKVGGGMGDHIMAARFIRDLTSELGGMQFDIFSKRENVANWLFSSIPGKNETFHDSTDIEWVRQKYICIIEIIVYANPLYINKTRIVDPRFQKLKEILSKLQKTNELVEATIKYHPNLDGNLGRYVAMKNSTRHEFPHLMAALTYRGDELDISHDSSILQRLGLNSSEYFTISNGYDEQTTVAEGIHVTKVYPHYEKLVWLLKQKFPRLKIIQIGTGTGKHIPGVDINLIGKTTLEEVAGLLKDALLHIDNEGGLVHLARAMGNRSCVIFGPTLAEYFSYKSNLNFPPPICGGCWWMESTWMTQCIRGESQPPCMFSRNPEDVATGIQNFLETAALK